MINLAEESSLTTGGHSFGQKQYELKNHLGNVLTVVSDRKKSDGNASIISARDYYPFGGSQTNRSFNASASRYSFNAKEDDRELGEWQDYGMRMYMKKIGRFPTPDPLMKSYPMLTPYQFASNTPILAVDLDGLEAANARARLESAFQGAENLEMNNVSDGFGDIQEQHYKIMVGAPANTVADLKDKIVTDINSIYGTPQGDFEFYSQKDEKNITVGDIIEIDPGLKGFNIFVKVADVQVFDNDREGLEGFDHSGFSITFRTLEGHVEVGIIRFTAMEINTPTGEKAFTFDIESTSRINNAVGAGLNSFSDFARNAQRSVWHQVINNVYDFMGGVVQEAEESVTTFESDDFKEVKDNEKSLGTLKSGANPTDKKFSEIKIDNE